MIIIDDEINGIKLLKKSNILHKGYLLSQKKYTGDIFDQARFTDNKTLDIPFEFNAKYSSSNDTSLLDYALYRTIIGNLVYLTFTRPNIAYSVYAIRQFVASPNTIHSASLFYSIFGRKSFIAICFHLPLRRSCSHTLMLIIASLIFVSS